MTIILDIVQKQGLGHTSPLYICNLYNKDHCIELFQIKTLQIQTKQKHKKKRLLLDLE